MSNEDQQPSDTIYSVVSVENGVRRRTFTVDGVVHSTIIFDDCGTSRAKRGEKSSFSFGDFGDVLRQAKDTADSNHFKSKDQE